MHIIDMEGQTIQVTDLETAIAQADHYRHYQHTDKEYDEFEKIINAYWNDVYEKLIQLRN